MGLLSEKYLQQVMDIGESQTIKTDTKTTQESGQGLDMSSLLMFLMMSKMFGGDAQATLGGLPGLPGLPQANLGALGGQDILSQAPGEFGPGQAYGMGLGGSEITMKQLEQLMDSLAGIF